MVKIALDFDSVLADTMISWVNAYNLQYKTFFTKDSIRQWEFWHDFDISWAQAKSIFEHVWENWEVLPETEQNLEKHVTKLHDLGIVDIVTTVSESHTKHVKNWLKCKKIRYANFVQTKEKINLEYDIFIDDYHELAINLSAKNKMCLLYNQPWNQNVIGNKIIRIQNLSQAFDVIKKTLNEC